MQTMPVAKLRLGSHCSGWESLTMAAKAIGLDDCKIDHKFASDLDVNCRRVIRQSSPSNPVIYKDVTKVNHRKTPKVHIFGAGVPCQPFSPEGLRRGRQDPRGRVTDHVVKYIKLRQPKSFFLENVPQFAGGPHWRRFNQLIETLEGIKDEDNTPKYVITHRVLNTALHGIPQERKRLYIVGVSHSDMKSPFEWPKELPRTSAAKFLDPPDENTVDNPEWPGSQTRLKNLLSAYIKIGKDGDDPMKDFRAHAR